MLFSCVCGVVALWWLLVCLCGVWRSVVDRKKERCFQFSFHSDPLLYVSVDVERKEQPKVAAGSWQEWSGWRTSDSMCGEGVWNKK